MMPATLNQRRRDRVALYLEQTKRKFLKLLVKLTVNFTRKLTPADVETIYVECNGLNSYERHLLYPQLGTAALLAAAMNCLRNCSPRESTGPNGIPKCYDDAMIEVFVPLLLEQLSRFDLSTPGTTYRPPISNEELLDIANGRGV